MKFFRQILVAVLLTGCLLFVSCSEETFRIEKQVSTARTDAYTQFLSYSKIAPAEAGSHWTDAVNAFNSEVEGWLVHLTDSLKAEADTLLHCFEQDSLPHPAWICQFYVTDTVFRADPDYISLRLDVYTYMGGANGNSVFKAFNYDVRRGHMMQDAGWIDLSRPDLVDPVVQSAFKADTTCFVTAPTAKLASCLNFTENEVVFSYNRYVLGPRSCGTAEIPVPCRSLKSVLRFK